MDAWFLLQLVINGIVIGAIYALVASGLSIVFGVLGLVNFAHGELYMAAAMAAYFFSAQLGAGYPLMIVLSVAGAFAAGVVLYEGFLRFLAGKDFERGVLATMGLSMVLQNGAIFLFTTTPRTVQNAYAYTAYSFGEVAVPVLRLAALGLSATALGLTWAVLHHTQLGRAMRGVSQNPEAAAMVGIDARRVSRLAVAMGVALAGLAGAALAPVYAIHPTMGVGFVFKAFAIVIIGGLGNFGGTVVAAMLIGMVESLAGTLISVVAADILSFVLMIAVLLLRPEGLFGRGVRL